MAKTRSRLDIRLATLGGEFAIEEYQRLRRNEDTIPDELWKYIDAALLRHKQGESLDKAFGIKRGPGRPPGSDKLDEAQQVEATLAYIELTDAGESEPNARRDVSIEFGVGEDTVEKYARRHEVLARDALRVKAEFVTLIARAEARAAQGK